MSPVAAGRWVVAFGGALILVSLLNAVLVIVKEEMPVVKAAMKAATGHHWLSHGLVVLLAFGLLGALLSTRAPAPTVVFRDARLAWAVLFATVLSGLMMFLFYAL